MILNVILSAVIILIWAYSATLSFSFYATSKVNRFFFKHIYVIGVLNIFQAVLGIYFIVTGNPQYQSVRWMTFSLININFLYFVLRAHKNRHIELLAMSLFNTLVLINSLYFNVWLECIISAILVALCYFSGVRILKKYFTWVFVAYSLTSITPTIFGFTTFESLAMGVVFSFAFMFGVIKLYKKEKVDDELKKIIINKKIQ